MAAQAVARMARRRPPLDSGQQGAVVGGERGPSAQGVCGSGVASRLAQVGEDVDVGQLAGGSPLME